MNQIQTLIANHIQGDENKRQELIQSLGIEHPNEAKAIFSQLERSGEIHSKRVRRNLHTALGLEFHIVHDAYMCDKDEQDEAKEIAAVRARHGLWKKFEKPFIQVRTENEIPSSLMVTGFTGSWRRKTIALDADIVRLPAAEQCALVSKIVVKHYEESRMDGYEKVLIPAFGLITAYDYRPTYFHTVEFDITGKFVRSRWGNPPNPVGRPGFRLRNKDITDILPTLLTKSPYTPAQQP